MSTRGRRRRRTGELEEEEGQAEGADSMSQLAAVLERVLVASRTERPERFKAPEYDGKGDVQYFWKRFQEVSEANQWSRGATLLHLRAALTGSALDCGRYDTVEEIRAALQARFGVTVREARAKLSTVRRAHHTSLQEHAAEIEKLTNIAYEELPARTRQQLALDSFYNTLGHPYLQRHLLAVNANSLEEAVRAGVEYLTIKPKTEERVGVRAVGGEEEISYAKVAQTPTDPLLELTQIIQGLTKQITAMEEEKPRNSNRSGPAKPPVRCWTCNQEGHTRSRCPKSTNQNRSAGNGADPQQ